MAAAIDKTLAAVVLRHYGTTFKGSEHLRQAWAAERSAAAVAAVAHEDFARLVAGLIRVSLEGAPEKIPAEARGEPRAQGGKNRHWAGKVP